MILHKIGVTSQQVGRRIADARNDATFLMAPVEIVATYVLKNLSRAKVEKLLHRFFEPARPAELSVTDRMGKKIPPASGSIDCRTMSAKPRS
ncbi:GIY-YIG nuclease family protein [Paracoccaceae bacterium Fryx2]|nr:GIY-YIG nuclease family protein [Paracoccaceae bacterium Fryx2]